MALQMRIKVNGQTFNSIDEMPPDVRQQYQHAMATLPDRETSAVADMFEGKFDTPEGAMNIMATSQRYVVNGTEYSKFEELPPHIQKLLIKAGQAPAAPPPKPEALHDRMRRLDASEESSGVTIRLSWGMLVGLVIAFVAAVVILALMLRH